MNRHRSFRWEPKIFAMIPAVIGIDEERNIGYMIYLRSTREGLTLYKDSSVQAQISLALPLELLQVEHLEGSAGAIAGSAAGAVIANVLKNIGSDISERNLSPREEVRVGAALIFAINTVQEKITNGYKNYAMTISSMTNHLKGQHPKK